MHRHRRYDVTVKSQAFCDDESQLMLHTAFADFHTQRFVRPSGTSPGNTFRPKAYRIPDLLYFPEDWEWFREVSKYR
jgi:hypothetical protein